MRVPLEDICECGHTLKAHYVYILNGMEQVRCKDCDPFSKLPNRGGNIAMSSESRTYKEYHAADHDFKLMKK